MLHVVQSTFPQFELFARMLIDWPAIICVQAMLSQLAIVAALGEVIQLYCLIVYLSFIFISGVSSLGRPSFQLEADHF